MVSAIKINLQLIFYLKKAGKFKCFVLGRCVRIAIYLGSITCFFSQTVKV